MSSSIWQRYQGTIVEPQEPDDAPLKIVATSLRRHAADGTVQGRIEIVFNGKMPPELTQSGVSLSQPAAREALIALYAQKRKLKPGRRKDLEQMLIAVETRVSRELDEQEQAQATHGSLYVIDKGRHCLQLGLGLIPLSNFTASIVREVRRDDGAEVQSELHIQGRLASGKTLPLIRVPSSRFRDMNWVLTEWGPSAIIAAGTTRRDQLREAIQASSPPPPVTVSYCHTGWRKLADGTWVYLHQGGAIGVSGLSTDVQVDLPDQLARFTLPAPPQGDSRVQAVRASLDLFYLGPDRITAVVQSGPYRAVLHEMAPIDYSVFIAGDSGAFKTELGALVGGHSGTFDRLHLPASWADTANAVERTAFLLKDAPLVIDDFVPTGTAQDVARLHATADRVFRGAGNRAGRARMTADGRLRAPNPPRCLAIGTGEEQPRGLSLSARMLLVEMTRGDLDAGRLTHAQEAARQGLYRLAMAAYLQWLAPQIETLRQTLPDRLLMLRGEMHQDGTHARTPDALASVLLGWEVFLRFAVEVGACTQQEADDRLTRVRAALRELGNAQTRQLATQTPAQRFMDGLRGVIASGRAHVASPTGDAPPHAERWGWRGWTSHTSVDETVTSWHPADTRQRIGFVEGDDLYLLPEAAYAAVQEFVRSQQGTPLVQARTLWRRLSEAGLLLTRDETRQRLTVRRTLAGGRLEVLHLAAPMFLGTEPSPSAPGATTESADNTAKSGEKVSPGDGSDPQSHTARSTTSPEENAAQPPKPAGTVAASWDSCNLQPSQQNGLHPAASPLEARPNGTIGTVGTVTPIPPPMGAVPAPGARSNPTRPPYSHARTVPPAQPSQPDGSPASNLWINEDDF